MKNKFDSLNEALDSEGLLDTLDLITDPIDYDSTWRYFYQDIVIVVHRDEKGRYERPIHYKVA